MSLSKSLIFLFSLFSSATVFASNTGRTVQTAIELNGRTFNIKTKILKEDKDSYKVSLNGVPSFVKYFGTPEIFISKSKANFQILEGTDRTNIKAKEHVYYELKNKRLKTKTAYVSEVTNTYENGFFTVAHERNGKKHDLTFSEDNQNVGLAFEVEQLEEGITKGAQVGYVVGSESGVRHFYTGHISHVFSNGKSVVSYRKWSGEKQTDIVTRDRIIVEDKDKTLTEAGKKVFTAVRDEMATLNSKDPYNRAYTCVGAEIVKAFNKNNFKSIRFLDFRPGTQSVKLSALDVSNPQASLRGLRENSYIFTKLSDCTDYANKLNEKYKK